MIPVIVDTREQRPRVLDPDSFTMTRATLRTGDYCLEGDVVALERKSLEDFMGTIGSGWDRFQREIDRMEGWPAKIIIVEGDYRQIMFGPGATPPEHNHLQLTPAFARKRIAQLSLRQVSVLFATDAGHAAGLASAIFRERHDHING